jgi:hypothetical protein
MEDRFETLVTKGTPKQAKLALQIVKKAYGMPDILISRFFDVCLFFILLNVRKYWKKG